ncbi:TPA: hypothetical protein N0F65_012645 [Lagenidium giganteum]|uniref:PH domain-containing protein n=1 Tax=Lagenidium giganteum TaxID=4803 RepID=A0AAV2YNK8_9STRA|nr:TPA: hypothetical protein N0F65_012645 [Lagenidium giganteum]
MVEENTAAAKAENKGTAKLLSSTSSKSSRALTANYRTGTSACADAWCEGALVTDGDLSCRGDSSTGYLFKKTRDGKWQKRWFETNGCFLTYYKKQGQKLLAALNLPQVGAITLLKEDSSDGPGLFTIELNERVYTIKARSHEEAAFWVDALLWRQAGGVVQQKSPAADMGKIAGASTPPAASEAKDTRGPSAAASPRRATKTPDDSTPEQAEEQVKGGCCCTIQ